ncbi:MAG: hypothetical protein LBQ01_07780 [Prevotellaceae bacterium]|jgi:hypothetical protein|nr:hypothetical protein [Prevotellaceae bacterium]
MRFWKDKILERQKIFEEQKKFYHYGCRRHGTSPALLSRLFVIAGDEAIRKIVYFWIASSLPLPAMTKGREKSCCKDIAKGVPVNTRSVPKLFFFTAKTQGCVRTQGKSRKLPKLRCFAPV